MKVLKNILKYVILIIISVAIIILIAIKVLSSTILEESYILNEFDESDYYNNIYQEVKNNFENYIGQSGLDENVMDNICSVEQVKNDTIIVLGNIYEGASKVVDTESIRNRLNENIKKSLSSTKITASMQKSIDIFVNEICEEYKNTISHTKYESKIYNGIKEVKTIIEKLEKIMYVVILGGIVFIIVLNLKKLNKAISLVGISMGISGIFYIILKILIDYNIKIANIKILNESISHVVQNVIFGVFYNFVSVSVIMLVLGIILIIVGNILKIQKENEN